MMDDVPGFHSTTEPAVSVPVSLPVTGTLTTVPKALPRFESLTAPGGAMSVVAALSELFPALVGRSVTVAVLVRTVPADSVSGWL
jgi:hypothetical protein